MKRNYFQKEILAFTTGNFSIHREEKNIPQSRFMIFLEFDYSELLAKMPNIID